MSIKATCQCGKTVSVKDEYAGRKVTCPACQQPLKIAAPDEFVSDEFDDEPAELPRKPKSKGAKKGKKSPSSNRGLLIGLGAGGGLLAIVLLAWLFWPAKPDAVAETPAANSVGTPATGPASVTATPIPAVSPTSPSNPTTPASTESLSDDLKALQGTWEVSVPEISTDNPSADKAITAAQQHTFTIKGDTLAIHRSCGISLHRIKIDPLQTPGSIDITLKYTHEPALSQLGLYSIEGETWKWCLCKPGDARPLALKTDQGFVITFRRSSLPPAAPVSAFNMQAWRAAEIQFKALNVRADMVPVAGEAGFADGITHAALIDLPDTADGTMHSHLWNTVSSLSHVMLRTVCTTDATLEQASWHPSLLGLNLSGRFSVTPAGISHLKSCSQLSNLQFGEVPVSAELVSAVTQLRQLRGFGIYKSPVSSEMLGSITQLNQLESLSLQEAGITDADALQIAKLTKLKSLLLNGSKITDTGLQTLQGLKDLTYFDVRGLNVTPQAVAEFEAALPKCKVFK